MKISILDTGISNHPFLGHIPTWPEGEVDVDGHGTHVAGIVLQAYPEARGRLLSARVMVDGGLDSARLKDAVEWSVKEGARIINASWGGPELPEILDLIKWSNERGCYWVCAAGNHGRDSWFFGDYPAAYDEVICVGSLGPLGLNVAEWSSRNRSLDLVTQGAWINSTWLNGEWKYLSGTSMAAPVVAAGALRCLDAHEKAGGGETPVWDFGSLRWHLIKHASNKDGWHRDNGFGIFDPKVVDV